jgi:hypothetical protein
MSRNVLKLDSNMSVKEQLKERLLSGAIPFKPGFQATGWKSTKLMNIMPDEMKAPVGNAKKEKKKKVKVEKAKVDPDIKEIKKTIEEDKELNREDVKDLISKMKKRLDEKDGV